MNVEASGPVPAVPTLDTPRLVLRELRRADLDPLAAVLGDPLGMEWYPHPFSREETLAWIERDRARYAELGYGHLGVVLRETGELIGDCGPTVLDVDGVPEVELGWHIRLGLWGRGYATEAAIATRDWMFDGRGLERLIALVRPENAASCRVAEKIGMHVERETDRRGWRHYIYAMAPADRPALRDEPRSPSSGG